MRFRKLVGSFKLHKSDLQEIGDQPKVERVGFREAVCELYPQSGNAIVHIRTSMRCHDAAPSANAVIEYMAIEKAAPADGGFRFD